MKYSKIEAVESMLNTAIYLFFTEKDDLAVHLIVKSCRSIIRSLEENQNVLGFEQGLKVYIKPEHLKEFFNKCNEKYNFLKHADRDPLSEIEFVPDHNLIELVVAMLGYEILTKKRTRYMDLLFCYSY